MAENRALQCDDRPVFLNGLPHFRQNIQIAFHRHTDCLLIQNVMHSVYPSVPHFSSSGALAIEQWNPAAENRPDKRFAV